jgi:hypothetical protein
MLLMAVKVLMHRNHQVLALVYHLSHIARLLVVAQVRTT